MVTDVTRRNDYQQRIKSALDRYNMVSAAIKDVIWEWDIPNKKIIYGYGMKEVFGYSEENILLDSGWSEKNIHPNDVNWARNYIAKIFFDKKTNLNFEFRFRCANGKFKYVLDRGVVKYDESGKPVMAIGVIQDITKERGLNKQIAKAANDAEERERQQISLELHDNVNQLLSASVIYLGVLREKVKKRNASTNEFEKVDHFIRMAIEEIRKLTHRLAPVTLQNDLPLKELFDELIKTMTIGKELQVHLDIETLDKKILNAEFKMMLYRILQEQMSNIIKFAGATELNISLKKEKNCIKFVIADNGKGSDTKIKPKGIGLENIRRRAKLMSGEMKIKSSPGNGCELEIELPVEN